MFGRRPLSAPLAGARNIRPSCQRAPTSVDAVVGIYGRYDWEDRSTPERAQFVDFLERVMVVQRTIDRREVFRVTRRRSNESPNARSW